MTDIAIRHDQHLDVPTAGQPATGQLVQWAQAAVAAAQYAEAVCNTQAVPAAYRGKPQEATAAILAGAEVGLSPMASLRAFDNIQGTPAPKAITLRSIVQGQGHEVVIKQSTPTIAVVAARRQGSDEWQTSTWTIERAQAAGYVGKNPKYRTNPGEMLVARATAEACRWVGADAIMGMPYSAEEIRDEGGATFEPRPKARRITAADILEHDEPAAIDPAPALTPAEVLDEIRDAQTQTRLDEIKALCQDNGIRDPEVLNAWAARSAQLIKGV